MARKYSDELRAKLNAKFDEICDLLAAELGYDKPAMTPEEKNRLVKEAEQTIDQWEESAEMEIEPLDPKTPLQKLLREYHEISESILDNEDDEGGPPTAA